MRNIILNAPVERGQFMSLKDCGEAPFVNGSMGRGAAVTNTSGRIVSPFSGRVLTVYRNAISITSNNGINLFIQISDNSFYEVSVRENQQINANQLLAYFNVSKIVMFAVKNEADFGDITFQLGGRNYLLQKQSSNSSRTNNSSKAVGNITLNAPVERGQFMSLKDCGEAPFVNGAMGRGVAVTNTSGRIVSPFSGRVLTVYRNAISIASNNGINLFIQISDNSFYEVSVRENQTINANQILAYFSVSKIVMFAVKNEADFGDITFQLGGRNYLLQKQSGNNTRTNNSKEDKPQSVSNTRANNSKEDNSMEGRKFTILGETGSGKTCYLLGMYYEMSMSVAGYTVVATDPDADKNLRVRYDLLKNKSRGKGRFPAGTEQAEKYNFKLNYNYETIHPFQWVDYPGSYLNPTRRDISSKEYQEVAKSIRESEMLFICIDGANLVGSSTHKKIRNVKTRCSNFINPYLNELRNKLKAEKTGLPPIGMLITKYDICADDTDADEVREIVEEAFDGLFGDNDTFVAIIPVSLGDTLEDDDCQGDLDPLNVHLPILMGINFALIDQLEYGKQLIESQRQGVNDLREWKRYEDDRWAITRFFFGGRDPDDIQNDIRDLEKSIQHNRQVAAGFKKSLKRMNRELAEIDMIYYKGAWQDKRGINQMWAGLQSIADYNF